MNVLGINLNHISSACIFHNGSLIASSTEERFTRNKLTRDFPYQAINFCLNKANINIKNIDAVSIGWNPAINLQVYKKSFSNTYRWFPELLYIIPNNLFNINKFEGDHYISQKFYSFEAKKNIEIFFVNHHLCHLAQSFLSSGFKNSGLLSVDGFGERTSTAWGVATTKEIKILKKIEFPQSLGSFYETATEFLGYTADSDEWKVMGMSAYGNENKYMSKMNKLLKNKTKNFEYEIDLSYFNYFNFDSPNRFSLKYQNLFKDIKPIKNLNIKQNHYDFASATQRKYEEVFFNLLNYFKKFKKQKNICLGGGSIMNCLANGKLGRRYPEKNFYIPFSPDDSGLSIGSAMYVINYIYKNKIKTQSIISSNGIEYQNNEIKKKLLKYGIKFCFYKNIEDKVSELLIDNKIIGWFQGRAEFGQRALGNRSIIANPTNKNIKKLVNSTVKYRESYRPFAPSCLLEEANKYFDLTKNINPEYMQYAIKAKPIAKKKIPSVIHNDGTSRIQIVTKEKNIQYFKLLKAFKKKSGVGVILNTSFNLKGEPIVNSPEDAIRTFFTSGLDYLVIGNYLIKK